MTSTPRSSSTPVDAVLLDMDGTLIDSNYQHTFAWAAALADEGLWCPMWRIQRTIGMGGDHLVEHLFDEATEERVGEKLREGWERHYQEQIGSVRALPGAKDLVLDLRKRGLKVALASSSPDDLTDKALEMLELTRDDFDAVTTSADADSSKPDPDILAVAQEKIGSKHAVMVGDSTWDVVAAQRTQVPTVCVRTGGFGADELTEAGAVHVADSVADLVGADWDELVSAH